MQTNAHTAPRRRQGFRPDIQALRAFAVLIVVGVHLWPEFLPGGFVGVDVFFVISGFLITSHLLKELDATGRIRLVRFYARRVKRLLPAAFTVIAAAGAGVAAFMPWDRWEGNFREIAAASAYVHNLLLARDAVDYHAQGQGASVVQHYWSLSVEEQFYLLWPALMLAFFALAGRRLNRARLGWALGAFGAGFFLFNLWFTGAHLRQAYFFTPVRFWEFAAGAGVAVALPRLTRALAGQRARRLAALGAAVAWLALLATAFLLTPAQPFPGWWALAPVTATAALIALGSGGELPALGAVTSLRPIQFLGDASYSIYLWHWPLIVLAPFALRYAPRYPEKLGILALTILLAALTKRWIEDPGQRIGWAPGRVLSVMAVAVAAAVAASWALIAHANAAKERFEAAEQEFLTGACAGPRALLEPACGEQINAPLFKPFLSDSAQYYAVPAGCAEESPASGGMPRVLSCKHSGGASGAQRVYLVGDSHAQQWQHVINEIAREEGWDLYLVFKGGCAIGNLPLEMGDAQLEEQCAQTQRAVLAHLEQAHPDRIIYTTFAVRWAVNDGTGNSQEQQYADGLAPIFTQWAERGAQVSVIADSPLNGAVRQVECAAVNQDDPQVCAAPRDVAIPARPLNAAVAQADHPSVNLVDLTDAFCDAKSCYQAVGGVLIYYDYDHLQRQYTGQLVDVMRERLLGSK
ncbi:acyltransferase family protein [Buchananella felis]|uniref:acyltransferase family protein n=1 Tax=Buchananella felis TaxID=3231492 RepID=UPI0035299F00